jgi:hypothetical protein
MSKSIYARANELAVENLQSSGAQVSGGPISHLEALKAESIPCHYVRFHQPVPPGYDKEPVSEFKVKTKNKYSVESMLYHPTAGLIFQALNKRGEPEEDITPAANIIYVRV